MKLLFKTVNNVSFPSQLTLHRIQARWQESCEKNGLRIPDKALAEFKKRIKQSGSDQNQGGKAKLNFTKCDLDDNLVS